MAFAQQAPPPTLSGESFHQDLPTITTVECFETLNFTYSATGTTTGPYPGTFTEIGTLIDNRHFASFTINSQVGRVTGFKIGNVGLSCQADFSCVGAACEQAVASFNTDPDGFAASDTYEATITTADGTFTDHGLYSAVFFRVPEVDDPLNGFDESFLSALDTPVPVAPTTKDQCKHGGWKQFGFKNQGRCVAFVQRGPKP